jgi:hypothetical protein
VAGIAVAATLEVVDGMLLKTTVDRRAASEGEARLAYEATHALR